MLASLRQRLNGLKEALDMRMPAGLRAPSSTPDDGLPGGENPFHDRDNLASACGRICTALKEINA